MVDFIAASVSIVILLSVQIVPAMRFLVDVLGLRHFLEQNDPHLFVRFRMHDYNNSLAIIRGWVTLSVGSSFRPGIARIKSD